MIYNACRVVLVLDSSRSLLISVSTDGMSQAVVDMSEGWGASAVVWPRSIAIGHAYEDRKVIRVYIGETLGRLWRLDIDVSSDKMRSTR